jgi:hypothetical protein
MPASLLQAWDLEVQGLINQGEMYFAEMNPSHRQQRQIKAASCAARPGCVVVSFSLFVPCFLLFFAPSELLLKV